MKTSKSLLSDRYWIDEQGYVGLTPEFMSQLGVIWAIVLRPVKTLTIGEPFINLESSKMLGPLRSPITREIVWWNTDLVDTPEKLCSDTPLIKVKL